jgi:cyclophilin family peptidyl-prolyl cis-trans isomerase
MAIDPNKQYLATLKTEKGDIVIQLYPDKAPFTVNSFIFLARQGWYNGVTFHYVSDNPAVAQTGDPSATGWGGPGYTFLDEISPDLAFDRPGVVAMANMGPDTNGSQFFITRSAIPSLDGRYPIFGQVIEGLQIVDQLTLRDPSLTGAQTAEAQPDGDKILEVTILEK